jgi:hypothetical protein
MTDSAYNQRSPLIGGRPSVSEHPADKKTPGPAEPHPTPAPALPDSEPHEPANPAPGSAAGTQVEPAHVESPNDFVRRRMREIREAEEKRTSS